jgi:hypothetical protein
MKYLKKFESFNIDEDSEHLKDLSLDLQDEGEWSITIHTNTEKYNEDEYSCKVILEPLEEFDWDGPGVAEGNDKGGKINDTIIQYLEEIVKYMEDYDYKIIICDNDQDPFSDQVRQNTIDLENLEELKKWIKKEIGYQGKTKSTEVDDGIVLSTEYPEFLNFGFKGDFIIIEFYEKDDEINESNIPYKYDWCRHESPIRKEIDEYIKDILYELTDSDKYTYLINWTQEDPYVWISGKIKSSGFSRYRPVLDEVNSAIDEITSYLEYEGFDTRLDYLPNKENCTQFYIFFKEKSSS